MRDITHEIVHNPHVQTMTISELKRQSADTPLDASVVCQLQSCGQRTTKAGKPYLEVALTDGSGKISLKIWEDAPTYELMKRTPPQTVLQIEGKWTQGGFGVEGRDLHVEMPDEATLEQFFAGDPVLRARQDADYSEMEQLCQSIHDPRLKTLCERFFEKFGSLMKRTAAARRNHHARRGGLVEHTAQMMRSASALCGVYPELNRDLLLCGVLFHDSGKLWENSYPLRGFAQNHLLHGEMLGHISLGIELVNSLWREISEQTDESWNHGRPKPEETRLHLLHLIASHHGELEFGSPVLPHTPEAFALHFIDNIDAKLEMLRDAYAHSPEIAPGIYERVFPLASHLAKPLPVWMEGLPQSENAEKKADFSG